MQCYMKLINFTVDKAVGFNKINYLYSLGL